MGWMQNSLNFAFLINVDHNIYKKNKIKTIKLNFNAVMQPPRI